MLSAGPPYGGGRGTSGHEGVAALPTPLDHLAVPVLVVDAKQHLPAVPEEAARILPRIGAELPGRGHKPLNSRWRMHMNRLCAIAFMCARSLLGPSIEDVIRLPARSEPHS